MRVFCGEACRSGWKADRCHGAIYPAIPWHYTDGRGKVMVSHYADRVTNGTCPYCGSITVKYRRKDDEKVRAACKRAGEVYAY